MTLVEVEKHADEVKGEIAVTRRATYKVEEDITKAEAGKKAQDLLIDRLNEELSGLHDKYARYEAQLAAQRRETGAAGNTLGDAAREMEQIQFEKKQLLGQWRSALLGMQRRDEALQATLGAIRRQQEQGAALEAELRAITKAQAKAEEAHEALTQRQRRVLADKAEGERVIAQNTEKHKKLNEKFAMCKRALDATDAELSKAQAARQTASDEIAAVEAKVQKVAREAAKLDGQRLNALSEQTALDKASHNLKAAIERKQAQIGEKEMAAAALENDLARIKVDALNTTASNVLLRQRLEQLNAELRDKDALVARYEQEAKRRNDEIGKKELGVTQLSRRLDAMKEKAGLDAAKAQAAEEEAAGPLEATIRELRDEIERKAAESAEMQRQWIGGQTELVGVENDNATRSEAILEMRSRLTVLEQKRARLDGQLSAQNRELLELGRGMEGMHHQMTKMNMLIAKQRGLRESLANETHALEAGFVHRLREMEAECLKTEAQVGALAAEKERLLTDVAESERELLLWEKKIALERETQAAIDPEVGSGESKAMLKEIHRMKLRFSTLKKREEEMLAEMEKAIYKRDNIEAKGRTAALKAPGETQAALRKSVADLSKRVTLTAHDAGAAHEDVTRMRQRQADLAAELEALDAQRREMLAQEEALHAVRAPPAPAAAAPGPKPRPHSAALAAPSRPPARALTRSRPCARRPTRFCLRASRPFAEQAIQTQEIERAFHETETHKNGRVRTRRAAQRAG